MIYLAVIGGGVVVGIVLAVIYDRRAKRRGWRVSASTEEAFQNRVDIESQRGIPYIQGGKQDWMTYRHRDQH
jgi:hypothetical protein